METKPGGRFELQPALSWWGWTFAEDAGSTPAALEWKQNLHFPLVREEGMLRRWGTALHGGLPGVSSFRLSCQCECGVVGENGGCMDVILPDLGSCEPQGLQGKGVKGDWTCVPGEGRRRRRWGGGEGFEGGACSGEEKRALCAPA